MMYLIPQDKANHMVYGAGIACVALCLASPFVALVAVSIVASLKEIYDRFSTNHTADPMDIIATIGGGVLVVLPTFVR